MEVLKHECGIAMVRLLKPLEYYQQKYGTWMFGLNKLYLMMEKQHNRGQEGAGMACVNLDALPGSEYMFRERAEGSNAITKIFGNVQKNFKDLTPKQLADVGYAKKNLPFAGELYMGHLRYSTTGKSGLSYVHPFLRRNNWRAKNLCLCGNFNMTNIDEIFDKLVKQGQSPRIYSDSYIALELMGHRLDREVERNFVKAKELGLENKQITEYINDHVEMRNVLKSTMTDFDGGYVVCGITGSGEMFSMRDPWGIRPAFYYKNDEFVAVASERPVLQTTFDLECEDIKELSPGHALMVKRNGDFSIEEVIPVKGDSACSFERIYFSRGSDIDIYKERKKLGETLVPDVLKAVDNDLDHTVFSFIPNTAEVAYYGMLEELNNYLNGIKKKWIADKRHLFQEEELEQILSMRVRTEKVAIKDIKLRTFIAEGNSRNDLAAHVYDITYGSIVPFEDNLVVIDDSIVRGTTLKQSIISILDRLHPKKIVIVSSSPQVRYPDYYGIDMSRMNEFIAFKAAVALLEERGMENVLMDAYQKAKKQERESLAEVNYVKEIYAPFTDEEISSKMVDLLTPVGTKAQVQIVYQTIEGLHASCPNHPGDWYFSGDYPTPGGVRMVNRAFIHYMEEEYLVK